MPDISHQRGSTGTGNTGSSVCPRDDRPAPAGGFPSPGIRMTPDAATSSPAAEREWYRMRTADTEKGSSYSSNDSRADQFSRLAGRQRMSGVIELCDGQGPQNLRTLPRYGGLDLRVRGCGCE
jgi:hypothetical protein